MITSLRLLQTKYSLSDEFIANAIRAEIERQALLDIKGVISNASPLALETMAKIIVEPRLTVGEIIGESDEALVKSLAADPATKPDPHIAAYSNDVKKLVTPASKIKGNRRGR